MANVREVRVIDDRRSAWTVAGSAGADVSFEAAITRFEPNELIAWKTLPGAAVQHAGVVRFDPNPSGTRVHVRMSYNPARRRARPCSRDAARR